MKEQIFLADLLIKTTGPSIPRYFDLSTLNWGPHTIDRFLSYYNAQLPRFNSVTWYEASGQKQIYKARPSVFSGCPKFKMLALRIDFR